MFTLVPRDRIAGVITGPIIWAVFFVLSYVISGSACSLGYADQELAGMNLIRTLLATLGALAGALIFVAGFLALRGLHRARATAEQIGKGAAARRHFLYRASLVLCAMSFIGVVWLTMNALLTPIC